MAGDHQRKYLVAHTGLEPVISALRGQRVNQLHQCAAEQRLIIGLPFGLGKLSPHLRFRKILRDV